MVSCFSFISFVFRHLYLQKHSELLTDVCTEMTPLSLISAKSHFLDSAKIPIIDGRIEKKTSLVR